MSNGKKWRDGKKVHRDNHRGFSRLIGGRNAKTAGNKWWFRVQIKNNSFGNTSMNDEDCPKKISFSKMTQLNSWFWN